ncbi:MAG TPA: hypothetical protein VE129_04100 [Thermoanaerobaculia bacterium]|nr:hypothetical protein [Thermoanaerobaculia bacterium]
MALRTIHIASMALVLGGIAWSVPDEKLHLSIVLTVASGVLLLAIDLAKSCVFLYQGAGVAALVKLALLGLGQLLPGLRLAFYLAATVVGSVGSHMSGAWRHWSFLDGKVLKQD